MPRVSVPGLRRAARPAVSVPVSRAPRRPSRSLLATCSR